MEGQTELAPWPPGTAGGPLGASLRDGPGQTPGLLPLRLFVPGRGRTKGSLRPVGRRANGSVILGEQVAGSKAWRRTVGETILRHLGAQPAPGGPVCGWEPWAGPALVRICVLLLKPPAWPDPWPTRRTVGDTDKFQRNIGDALVDARVLVDDGQIVGWSAWKRWVSDGHEPGVRLEVEAVEHGATRARVACW